MAMTDVERLGEIERLRSAAPRDRILELGAGLLGLLSLASWFMMDLELTNHVTGRSRLRLSESFLADVIPDPLQERAIDGSVTMRKDLGELLRWAGGVLEEVGLECIGLTIGISILAIVLGALMALPLVLPGARNVSLGGGFLPADRRAGPVTKLARFLVFGVSRSLMVVLRAIPEYLWAFLLLILLGPVALAGVLALALHNAGILAKLTGEIVEDADQRPLAALAGIGGGFGGVAVFGIMPRSIRQFLVYFFYRWETCVRETAVLGVLAIETLGLHIDHSFAYFQFDRAILLILVNSVIVIVGDLLGSRARTMIRREA